MFTTIIVMCEKMQPEKFTQPLKYLKALKHPYVKSINKFY